MTELAKRYGDSLYELAAEETLETELLAELEGAVGCLKAEPAYLRLLATPNIPKKERTALLDEAFRGQVHPYILNFFKLLCDDGALGEVSACAREYHRRYNSDHGIATATVVSALPLDDAARQKLTEKLSAVTGKTVELTVKVDPQVLGGLRVDMEGTRLDGTVARRLQNLRTEIAQTTL